METKLLQEQNRFTAMDCDYKSKINQLDATRAQMNNCITTNETNLLSVQMQMKTLQADFANQSRSYQKLIQELKESNAASILEKSKLEDDIRKLRKDLFDQQESHKAIIEAPRPEHAALEIAHVTLQENFAASNAHNAAFETAHAALKKECGSSKAAHAALKKEHAVLQTSHAVLQTSHAALQKECDSFKAALAQNDMTVQVEFLREQLNESISRNSRLLEEKCAENKVSIEQMTELYTAQIKEMEQERSAAEKMLIEQFSTTNSQMIDAEQFMRERDALETENVALKKEMNALRSTLSTDSTDHSQHMQHEIEQLTLQLQNINTENNQFWLNEENQQCMIRAILPLMCTMDIMQDAMMSLSVTTLMHAVACGMQARQSFYKGQYMDTHEVDDAVKCDLELSAEIVNIFASIFAETDFDRLFKTDEFIFSEWVIAKFAVEKPMATMKESFNHQVMTCMEKMLDDLRKRKYIESSPIDQYTSALTEIVNSKLTGESASSSTLPGHTGDITTSSLFDNDEDDD